MAIASWDDTHSLTSPLKGIMTLSPRCCSIFSSSLSKSSPRSELATPNYLETISDKQHRTLHTPMFSHSWCQICTGARDWRYTEEREGEFSLLSTDLPIGLILKKKKEPQLYNFSSVALQLLVTSDDYKETHTIKTTSKTLLKVQTRKHLCTYGCPAITFNSWDSVKNVLPEGYELPPHRQRRQALLQTQGMERRTECLSMERAEVYPCAF